MSMSRQETIATVTAFDIQDIIDKAPDDLESKIRAAMTAVKNHWLCTDKEIKLTAAVAGVCLWLHMNDRDHESDMIEKEVALISSLLKGTLDFSAIDSNDYNPIGLYKILNEVQNGES